jgi:hypothetical protein
MQLPSEGYLTNKNLTGEQIETILNRFLFRSLEPIALHTNLIDLFVSQVLRDSFLDHRRKLSNTPREVFFQKLFEVLVISSRAQKLKRLRSLRLERTLIFQLISFFLKQTQTYVQDEYDYLLSGDPEARYRMHLVEHRIGASRTFLAPAVRSVHFWLAQYLAFKDCVIGKFARFALHKTNMAIQRTKLQIERKDLYHNMILNVGRAIDKYDSNEGALAHYVKMWIQNAETNPDFSHELNTAFKISSAQRRKTVRRKDEGEFVISNLSHSIENLEIEDKSQYPGFESNEEISELCTALLKIPDARLAFLLHDIPFSLNADELAAQLQQTPRKVGATP